MEPEFLRGLEQLERALRHASEVRLIPSSLREALHEASEACGAMVRSLRRRPRDE
jgi:hypothetical protein